MRSCRPLPGAVEESLRQMAFAKPERRKCARRCEKIPRHPLPMATTPLGCQESAPRKRSCHVMARPNQLSPPILSRGEKIGLGDPKPHNPSRPSPKPRRPSGSGLLPSGFHSRGARLPGIHRSVPVGPGLGAEPPSRDSGYVGEFLCSTLLRHCLSAFLYGLDERIPPLDEHAAEKL